MADRNGKKCEKCIEDAENYERKIQNLTTRYCTKRLGIENLPLYSNFSPTLDRFMIMDMYEALVTKDGMTFQKMRRIMSIGMTKTLCKLPKETLQNIQSLEMEVFH